MGARRNDWAEKWCTRTDELGAVGSLHKRKGEINDIAKRMARGIEAICSQSYESSSARQARLPRYCAAGVAGGGGDPRSGGAASGMSWTRAQTGLWPVRCVERRAMRADPRWLNSSSSGFFPAMNLLRSLNPAFSESSPGCWRSRWAPGTRQGQSIQAMSMLLDEELADRPRQGYKHILHRSPESVLYMRQQDLVTLNPYYYARS
nr:hypothetical protein CFP56_19684 [Quercus suber]